MDNGHIRQRNNGGFTLLELMIVIVILGILGAIVAPKFMDEPHKARVVQEHVVHLQSGQDTLSVYIPATGTARILEGQFSLEQIRKEFL